MTLAISTGLGDISKLVTLGAGVAHDLFAADGLDISGMDCSIAVTNGGANPVTDLHLFWAHAGGWARDDSVNLGASGVLEAAASRSVRSSASAR